MRVYRIPALLVCLALAGCAGSDSDPIDAESDSFPSGKSDGGIDPGSPEAAGVLALVNDAAVTLEMLDDDARLHATAAANIIATRPFASLAELDAVPYVGPVALDRLLAYAAANGYVPTEAVELPNNIHWVRNSAEYHALVWQTYTSATREIEAKHAAGDLTGNWAVALDADETVLSNSLYQRERAVLGLGYSTTSWSAWVARREATPLPGATRFLERVVKLGGHIAIVTNRKDALCADTRANLAAEQVPHDVVLCRTGTSQKEPRWQMVEDGTASAGLPPTRIVMWIGDNIHDFPDLEQDLRFGAGEDFAEFGTKYVVIPNPMYGSWTGNAPD